jgi:nitrogen fixation NifU-like protein
MASVRELYQGSILEHSKNPRNFGRLAGARGVSRENPLCGDQVTLYVEIQNGVIVNISFEGEGCALSMASASVMSESIKGKTAVFAAALSDRFAEFLRQGELSDAESDKAALGSLSVFAPVHQFPARIECVRLAWRALGTALDQA